jgi:hypothetical protein
MRGLILAGILVCSLSCSRDTNFVSLSDDSNFAVYFLRDGSITTDEVTHRPLSQLELAAAPWFNERDLALYDFSTHCIYLKSDKASLFENFALGHFEPFLMNKPFVVVVGGDPRYLGCLHSGALSTVPPAPYMSELDVWYYPQDILHIARDRTLSQDMRLDPRVRESLIRAGLFHGGLTLELNSVTVLRNADTSTVEYRFTLRNDDRDPLYAFDPDRTGIDLFHYYTNGVVFSSEYQPPIWSEYKTVATPNPCDSWQPSCFTRIQAEQSIQRTVTLRGYPRIPKGQYTCRLTYLGPKMIERSQRSLADGRYWIGEIESNTIEVTIN